MFKSQPDSTRENFIKYLNSLGISPKSHKNYRSDLTHFTGWLILKVRSFGSYVETLTEALPFLNTNLIHEYRGYMFENQTPEKSINRRLTTLRHFSRFLLGAQIIDLDFMDGIENISASNSPVPSIKILEEFRSYLEAEKVSKNTAKNYISDIRQFLAWLESNQPINHSTN